MMNVDQYTATDRELITLINNHQRDAFEILYRRYFAKLYTVIYKRVKSKEITEEIIQDLFAELWVKRSSMADIQSFSAYIFRSVQYKIFKYFKREYLRTSYNSQAVLAHHVGNATEETVNFNELNARFDQAMHGLPAKSKKIFILSRKEFKSNKEIAAQLGITEKAVEYHITKTLCQLKVNLKDFLVYGLLLFLIS